jgi:galactonate dehydratase
MKIAEVESLVSGSALFVLVTTDSGLVGLGQAACWGYPNAVHEVVQTFRAYLIGQDPLRIEHHWQYLYRMAPFRGSVLSGAVSAISRCGTSRASTCRPRSGSCSAASAATRSGCTS